MTSTPAKPQSGFGDVLAARPERRVPTAPSVDVAPPSGAAASTTLGAALERQVGTLMDQ